MFYLIRCFIRKIKLRRLLKSYPLAVKFQKLLESFPRDNLSYNDYLKENYSEVISDKS